MQRRLTKSINADEDLITLWKRVSIRATDGGGRLRKLDPTRGAEIFYLFCIEMS